MKKALRKLAIFIVILLVAVAAYYLYDTLRERSFAEKMAEIIHQEDRRTLSEDLKKYLDSPDQRLRARTALAIGRIGGNEAAEILFGVISSESMDVASTAAFALGLTGSKEYAARLLDLAYDYPSQVGAKMVVAAGRLADSSMTEVADQLVEFLLHPSPLFREATCRALFLCGARSKGLYLIDLARDEPDEEVRKAVLYSLARLGISEGLELYSEFLADADPEIRSLAVRGLGRCETTEAEHLLAIALNDSDKRVVATAVAALSQKETETAKKALAERLAKEPDEKLLVAMIDGLRAQKNDDAIDLVRNILSRTPPPNVTSAAVRYLATVEKGRAVELIDSLVTLGVAPITVACADAFAIVEHDGVVPRLAVLFNDPDKVIRAAAFSNLVKIDSTNIDFYLRKALDDDDFVMVALALDVIEQQLLHDYLPAMRTMISRGTAIKAHLRRALASAAGKFLAKDRTDSLALKILIEGALDRDYIVRREAVDIYRDVLGEDRADMLRSARTHISAGRIENAIEKYQSNPYATIITSKGEVEMELYLDVAPLTVLNFIELASIGFYDSLSFHRVVPNFVVQGGDPHGDGWGGPGYYIRCEYSEEPFRRGTVGIATSGKDTGGSQFFITHSAQPHLEGRYTVFGQVLSGMDVIDEIVPGDLIVNIVIDEG